MIELLIVVQVSWPLCFIIEPCPVEMGPTAFAKSIDSYKLVQSETFSYLKEMDFMNP